MFKTVIIAVSGALIAAASPALADVARPGVASSDVSTADIDDVSKIKPVASTQRYCVKETNLDSRIPRKTCQTRAQWLRQGFDPLVK